MFGLDRFMVYSGLVYTRF